MTRSHHVVRDILQQRRGVLALLALALGGDACRREEAPVPSHASIPAGEVRMAPDSPKAASISIDTARAVTERVIATLPAQIVANEGHTVRVTSPVAGRIISLVVQAGDHVRAGQPLANLRSADAAQAASDAAKAATAWRTAQASLARSTDLFEHKVNAARDVEQARNDEALARAELARARSRVDQLGLAAGAISDTYVLRAPIAGVIIDRAANPGSEVRPDIGQPLFTISSLADVWLSVSVPQRDIALVHRGARLRFHTETVPGHEFDGRVSFVSDALDPVSHSLTARAVLANPGGLLRVQAAGEVQLLISENGGGVVIPTRALVTRGSDTVVFIQLAPGRFTRRIVVVRDDDGTLATIASGLSVGERVVSTGSLLLAGEADRAQ